MIKAIIFDFDGVLVDSEESRFDVIKHILKGQGIQVDASDILKMVGKPGKTFVEENFASILGDRVEQVLIEYKDKYLDHINDYVVPIQQTMDFITNYVGDCKFAVASMGTRKSVVDALEKFGVINKFSSIVTREDVTHHKPDPEIYIKVAKILEMRPSECVVIEDTLIGAQAAVSAGMRCFVLRNEYNQQADFGSIGVYDQLGPGKKLGEALGI